MARARDERHRFGQHYTPKEVASLLAALAVRSSDDLILDPACGDGRLLNEAIRIKRLVSARPAVGATEPGPQVFGIERSAAAVKLARRTGARIEIGDFFEIEPSARLLSGTTFPDRFDALIGNPPYIRQEVIGSADKQRIKAQLARDRDSMRDAYWPHWSGRSDIYVYFFAHSLGFLKKHGRLVFLTASSWLDVGYGAPLREFMLNNFRVIAVIESSAEGFFDDASINTCITVLEREPNANKRERNVVRFVRINKPLGALLNRTAGSTRSSERWDGARAVARMIERGSGTTAALRIRIVRQADLTCTGGPPWRPLSADSTGSVPSNISKRRSRRSAGSTGGIRSDISKRGGHGGPPVHGWGKYLRADDVFFRVLERGGARMRALSELARVRFGVKTGANEFFYVTVDNKEKRKRGKERVSRLLALGEVAFVRRGMTTGANEFFYIRRPTTGDRRSITNTQPPTLHYQFEIEPRFLLPVVFSLKEIRSVVLDRVESGKLFFHCEAPRKELLGTKALAYIKSGERAGYHTRPTCESRDPWYAVANGRNPAPLIFPSKIGERWVVALNHARVFEDKKLYGVFPGRAVPAAVLAALLNSTWARYYAEITCRQLTGAQAIADIDVTVAEQIMLPDPRQLSAFMRERLISALESLARRPVYSIFEEVKLTDRRRLDSLVLEALGISQRAERDNLLGELYEAMTRLVRARLHKSSPRVQSARTQS